jgi:hypothetical protein
MSNDEPSDRANFHVAGFTINFLFKWLSVAGIILSTVKLPHNTYGNKNLKELKCRHELVNLRLHKVFSGQF